MSADELLRMPHSPGRRYELVQGELKEMTPAGHDHGWIAGNVLAILWNAARRSGAGRVYAAETGYRIERGPDTVLAPDVSFVRARRVPVTEPGFMEGPPDFVVEVASPTQRIEELDQKVDGWLDAGASLAWVLWPQTRSVVVHRPDAEPVILHEDDRIEARELIPELHCRVGDLFE